MTRNVASSWRATELAINLVIARGCAQGHSNRAIVWTFAPPLLKYNLVPWCYVCDQVMYAVDTGQCAGWWWWWYPFPRFCKPPPLSGYCHIPLRRSQTVCLFVIISVWPPATLHPLALLPSCQYFTCWLIFWGNLLQSTKLSANKFFIPKMVEMAYFWLCPQDREWIKCKHI